MTIALSPDEHIHELKRRISSIEWDIPHIVNEELKTLREKELMEAEKQLDELLKPSITKKEEIQEPA